MKIIEVETKVTLEISMYSGPGMKIIELHNYGTSYSVAKETLKISVNQSHTSH